MERKGEARARERGEAAAAKFKTVPMTPGGCCGGVSPLGSEQVNTEPCLVLGVLYLPVQLVGPSKALGARRLCWFLAGGRKTWRAPAWQVWGGSSRDLGCWEKQAGISPESSQIVCPVFLSESLC